MQKFHSVLNDNRKIIAFLSSQAISLFGSSIVQYALMWKIVLDTKSGTVAALYAACAFAPQILISLFGGAWADRHSRKKLIMYADAGIAIATLILSGLMAFMDLGYAPIFVIAIVRALGGGIQGPAVSAVLPQLTDESKLMRVNGINGTIQSAVLLLSPPAALLALGLLPLHGILLIDVVTAAIAIAIVSSIPIPMHEHTQSAESHMLRDVKDGLLYAVKHFFVRRLTIYYAITSILIVPAAMFTPLYVARVYGDNEQFLMLNEMLFFVGGLVGGGVVAAWGGFKNRLITLAFGAGLFGLAMAITGLQPPFWLYLTLILIAGLTMPCFNAPVMSMLQEKIRPDMMGRVFSLLQIASSTIMMLATLGFGFMSDRTPLGLILLVSGGLMALMGLSLAMDRSFLQQGLPSAPADPAEAQE